MKKKICLMLFALTLVFSFVLGTPALAQEGDYQNMAKVSVDELNLRTGCGTDYNVVELLYRDMTLQILGEKDEWLMVYVPDTGMVGMVHSSYVTRAVETGTNNQQQILDVEKGELLRMINQVRNEAGLPDLQLDPELTKIAELKAMDMADNNYFGHNSEVYGNPFEMMTSYGLKFGVAGENIAGNTSVEKAFESWTDSDEHIRNIIGEKYTKVGIGIAKDETYGKIIVLEFTD